MAQLTTAERLAKVKTALGLSGTAYQDSTLQFYIDEEIAELIDAGVAQKIAESTAAVGCIALGVNDLWSYSSGGVKHSEQFDRRLIQLSAKIERTQKTTIDEATYTVPITPKVNTQSLIFVYVNDAEKTESTDYTITGQTITFTSELNVDDVVLIDIFD